MFSGKIKTFNILLKYTYISYLENKRTYDNYKCVSRIKPSKEFNSGHSQ